jgi:hypothetical protein
MKSEIRNPKEIRSPKLEAACAGQSLTPDFGFRVSFRGSFKAPWPPTQAEIHGR